jgi:hypothetical protein
MQNKELTLEYKGLKIDPIIFTQGFVHGCDVDICKGQCCDWGVYMDKNYRDVILEHENDIIDTMTASQIQEKLKWFEDETIVDKDFPSGYAIGTEVYTNSKGETQCVFKDDNNHCSIQVMAVKKNLHKWQIKPLHCILYPLTIVDDTLTYDTDHSGDLDYCGVNHPENFTQPVFEAMHEEIKFILGMDGFHFLNDYYIKNYKQKYQIDIPDFEHELTNKR